MATAGSIVVDLLVRTGSFETDTDRASKKLRDLQRRIDGVARTAVIAAATGFAALTAAVRRSINYMDEIGDAAERTSVGARAFSELAYAANMASLSQGELERVLRRSTEAINHGAAGGSKQAEALQALGVSAHDAAGNLKTADQMLRDLAEKFSKLEPSARKTGLVIDLFGQQLGQKVIPLLNLGASGLSDMAVEAERFGLVVDDEAARAAGEFNDNLDRLIGSSKGLAMSLTQELIPALNQTAQSLLAARRSSLWGWLFSSGQDQESPDVAIEKINQTLEKVRATRETHLQFQKDNPMFSWAVSGDIKDLDIQIAQLEGRRQYLEQLIQEQSSSAPATILDPITVGPIEKKAPMRSIDVGERLISQMRERVALLGKETEHEQLIARISIGSMKFKTPEMEKQALVLAQQVDLGRQQIEMETALRDLRMQASVTQIQFMRELEGFGQGENVRAMNSELARVEDRYRNIIEMRRNSPLGLSDIELGLIQASLQAELDLVQEYHEKKMAIQGDWRLGASEGLRSYADDAANVYQSMEQVVSGAFKGMEDALTEFVTTGKLDFKGLADSIIKDMVRIAIQQSITGPLAGAIGGMIGGGVQGLSMASSIQQGGGDGIGALIAMNRWSSGGYTGDGGRFEPAGIVHRGEGVLNQDEIRALGGPAGFEQLRRALRGPGHAVGGMGGSPSLPDLGGGKAPNVKIEVVNRGSPVQASPGDMRWDGTQWVASVVIEDIRRNGPIAQQLAAMR